MAKILYFSLVSIATFVTLCQSLNIDDFGARPFDTSYNASIANGLALNRALYAANAGPSRVVIIDSGKVYSMLPNSTVEHLVNVTLIINGRIDAWDQDENRWPNRDKGQDALPLISFYNVTGLTILGNGLINGNGYLWWWNVIITGYDNRPDSLININAGKNIRIDGVSFINAPNYHLNLRDMLNVTVTNVLIRVDLTLNDSIFDLLPTFPLNTDGIDIAGKDIYFRNLTITNFDDAVAVKPTNSKGLFSNCTENILVEDSYVKYGVGMTIGIS
jgi:polygalacturonase